MSAEQQREALRLGLQMTHELLALVGDDYGHRRHYVEAERQIASALAASEQAAPVCLTDERIDFIADMVVKGMEGGIQGFLTNWGWRQFARALLEDCAGHYAAPREQGALPPDSAKSTGVEA